MVEEIENIQDKEEAKSEETPLLVSIKKEVEKEKQEQDAPEYLEMKVTKEEIEDIEIE